MKRLRIASTLPKRLTSHATIRAATLTVVAQADGSYIVCGRQHNYHVLMAAGRAYCECPAARFKSRCSHAIAATRHYESHKP